MYGNHTIMQQVNTVNMLGYVLGFRLGRGPWDRFRARDMVVEQRRHFLGSGAQPLVGFRGRSPQKIFRALMQFH